jgi:hypothetical protein
MKKLILLLAIYLLLASASAITYQEEEKVCNKIFMFLVGNEGYYSEQDIENLRNWTEINFSRDYMDNYSEMCVPITGRKLPYLNEQNKTQNLSSLYPNCKTDIDSTPLGYNMDWSIPFFRVYFGKLGCDSVNKWKWWIRLEDNGENTYTMKGIKIWAVVSCIFLLLLLKFVFSNSKINSLINNTLEKVENDRFINKIEYDK